MTGKQSRLRVYLYLFAYVVLTAAPAAAQTQDDLFNDAELHDVMLTLSDRDWSDLKAHPEENTNYPADLRWRGITVRNNSRIGSNKSKVDRVCCVRGSKSGT